MYTNLYKQYSNSVVMLAKKDSNNVIFLGTGFLSSQYGHILTCSHIIDPLNSIVAIPIETSNAFAPMSLNQVQIYDLTLLQNDPVNDVALLKFKNDVDVNFHSDALGTSTDIEIGSQIAIIGYPFGHMNLHTKSITHGIISGKVTNLNNVKLLQFDCMIHQGYSGSPLIDLKNKKIIGIVTNRFNPMQNGYIQVGNHQLGMENNISYATIIEYGKELLKNEKYEF